MKLKLINISLIAILACLMNVSFASNNVAPKEVKREQENRNPKADSPKTAGVKDEGVKQSNDYYYKQFKEVFQHIEKEYVQEPGKQEMTDEAINATLHSLDPYSGYYTNSDLDFFLEHIDGEFGGIGVEIVYENGAVKIISPIDDLPAYKAGIKAGDYIVGVNGHLVSNMGFNKAVREMRGTPGTKLNLLVIKEDEGSVPKEIELTRETVKIKPVKFELEKDEIGAIAYVRVVTFNKQTFADLKKSIQEIEKQVTTNNTTLKGIILDLRNNPGGLLNQAVAMCEYFLDHGVIVSTKGRRQENNVTISAGRFVPKAPNVPIVILINAGTASASEIVAGALQDHKRAVILGTTSFGKGLVQTFSPINERSGVNLTTAKYYTPSGRSINAKGIEPDLYIENAKVEYPKKETKSTNFTSSSIKDYLNKYNVDEKTEDKTKEEAPERKLSDKYQNDYQYARAYDLIRGLVIIDNKRGK